MRTIIFDEYIKKVYDECRFELVDTEWEGLIEEKTTWFRMDYELEIPKTLLSFDELEDELEIDDYYLLIKMNREIDTKNFVGDYDYFDNGDSSIIYFSIYK